MMLDNSQFAKLAFFIFRLSFGVLSICRGVLLNLSAATGDSRVWFYNHQLLRVAARFWRGSLKFAALVVIKLPCNCRMMSSNRDSLQWKHLDCFISDSVECQNSVTDQIPDCIINRQQFQGVTDPIGALTWDTGFFSLKHGHPNVICYICVFSFPLMASLVTVSLFWASSSSWWLLDGM